MPKYWMISDRDLGGTGNDRNNNGVTFWTSDGPNNKGELHEIKNWERATLAEFRKALIAACAQFPDPPQQQQEEEKHVTLCIHGYNESFEDSIDFYSGIYDG